METLRLTLLALHVAIGTVAVAVGAVALVLPKGRREHRRSGRLFVWSMGVVVGTATVLSVMAFNPYFAGLTATAAIAAFSGWRVLGRKRPDLDPLQRADPVDWAVALVVLAVGVGLSVLVASGRMTENRPVVVSLAVGAILHALYDLRRFSRPAAFPFGPNLWLYEHVARMIAAYGAAVAAFSGSVLVVLDPPWRQLWAPALGQVLTVVVIVRAYRRLNRKATAASAVGPAAADRGAVPARGPRRAVEAAMLTLALLALQPARAQVAAVGQAAPPFQLADQYGMEYRLGTADPEALLFADRAGAPACRGWATALARETGRVWVVTVAVVGGVPRPVRGLVRGAFRGHDAALLDWDRRVARQYGYADGTCRVVVVRRGVVAGVATGELTGPAYGALAALLR
jgi:hypothetical protein